MGYEDPNAPPVARSGPGLRAGSSFDQSKAFLGGVHHPWRRFFARTVDVSLFGVCWFFLLMVVLAGVAPEFSVRLLKAVENPFVAGVLLYTAWLPVETLFISKFGSSPGKWLFGIKVSSSDGGMLDFFQAFLRSLLVWIQGLGLGLPIVSVVTQLFAYRRLTKAGTTLWDESSRSVVSHREWGVLRALLCAAAVISSVMLLALLNALADMGQ